MWHKLGNGSHFALRTQHPLDTIHTDPVILQITMKNATFTTERQQRRQKWEGMIKQTREDELLGGNSKTGGNDAASSGDEVKMLLQGRKQFENMTLGKGNVAVKLPSGGGGSWLDEEMESIQWPAGPC